MPDTPLNILVVDDEPGFRMLIEQYLTEEGFSVVTAEQGEEGMEKLRAEKIDFVISDIYMPVMDGLRFFREALKLPGHENTPFLFVSGFDDDHTRNAVLTSRNGGFMKKTRPIHELKEWITYLSLPKEKRPTIPPGAKPPPAQRPLDRDDRVRRR